MKRATDLRAAARARARGFTLIEMLVAIALLAVIALLSWRGLDATIRGRDDIASNLAQTRLLGRYFSQLQFDLMNLVTPDEVFGPPLRIRPGELVRSASQPLASLAEVDDALHHMDAFARVVVSNDARSMQLSVWIPPGGWTTSQADIEQSYAQFLAQHGISNFTSIGVPVPRGVRFSVTMGAPAVEYVRTIPIGQ
jgi:general secretion pathway protein J